MKDHAIAIGRAFLLAAFLALSQPFQPSPIPEALTPTATTTIGGWAAISGTKNYLLSGPSSLRLPWPRSVHTGCGFRN